MRQLSIIVRLYFFVFAGISFVQAQELHTTPSCDNLHSVVELDWSSNPNSTQVNWTPDGATSFTATNVSNSGYDIAFSVTGATGTFGSYSGTQTPNVETSLTGGVDALTFYSTGFSNSSSITITMTFSPAIPGSVAFDLYHVNRALPSGDHFTFSGLTSLGGGLTPSLAGNDSPSWSQISAGVINATASSTSGTNDQVGVNFTSGSDVSSITIVWRNCTVCSNAVHGFAIGDIEFCIPDVDADGVADTSDQDRDNDGIPDLTEGTGDADGDGIPNHEDADSDGDGIPDLIEAGATDSDNDTRVDGFTDSTVDEYSANQQLALPHQQH